MSTYRNSESFKYIIYKLRNKNIRSIDMKLIASPVSLIFEQNDLGFAAFHQSVRSFKAGKPELNRGISNSDKMLADMCVLLSCSLQAHRNKNKIATRHQRILSFALVKSSPLTIEIIGPLCNFTDKSKPEHNALPRTQADIGRK